jgi:hypothetical protein
MTITSTAFSDNALAVQNIYAGFHDPTVEATGGGLGTIYIRLGQSPTDPIGIWQHLDALVSTNWVKIISGTSLNDKDAVKAASVANVVIAVAPASLDGVAGVAGDRWLLKDQALPATNGIYIFNGVGVPLTRSPDADTSAEVTQGLFTWAIFGTVNQRTGWILTTSNPITLGTTPLTFIMTPLVTAGEVAFTPAIPGNWPTPPTNVDQALNDVGARRVIVEERIVTVGEAAAKNLTLTHTPFNVNDVNLAFEGVVQTAVIDFSVVGAVVSWAFLGMDTIGVVAGDTLVIEYFSET